MDKALQTEHHKELYQLEKKINDLKRQNDSIRREKTSIKKGYAEKMRKKQKKYVGLKNKVDRFKGQIEKQVNGEIKSQQSQQSQESQPSQPSQPTDIESDDSEHRID